MNFLNSRTFIGLIPLAVSSGVSLARKFGVNLPAGVEDDINQMLVLAYSFYLIATGHAEALNTPVPPKSLVIGDSK